MCLLLQFLSISKVLSLRCLWFIQFYFSNIAYTVLRITRIQLISYLKISIIKGYVPYGMLNCRLNIGPFNLYRLTHPPSISIIIQPNIFTVVKKKS